MPEDITAELRDVQAVRDAIDVARARIISRSGSPLYTILKCALLNVSLLTDALEELLEREAVALRKECA